MSGTYQAEIGNFIIAPDIITNDLGLVTSCIFGKIWRYEKMRDGVCKASISTLAEEVGVSYNTILTHIQKLIDAEYIVDLTPNLKNRPHIYKTTGKLRIEINILSTPQNLESTPQNLESHSSIFGDESESLIEELIEEKEEKALATKSELMEEEITPYQKLLVEFINASKLPLLGNLRPRDNEALVHMVKNGCTVEDIRSAVEYCTKNGYQIVGPASILNGTMTAKAKRERENQSTTKKRAPRVEYIQHPDGSIEEVTVT